MNKKLRFGIMLNGHTIAKWQLESVQLILDYGIADLELLIINDSIEVKNTFMDKIKNYPFRNLLYRLWKRYFLKIPSTEFINLPEKWNDIPQIMCKVIRKGKYSDYFLDDDVDKIRSFQLDFILRYGFNIIRGKVHQSTTYGIWSYHHGDEMLFRGGPIGFWEIYKGSKINGVILQKLNDKIDAGLILVRRNYQTVSHSYAEHVEKLLSQSSDMPLQVCKLIQSGNDLVFSKEESSTQAKINRLPTNIQTGIFISKLLFNRIQFHYERLFKQEKWDIGIRIIKDNSIQWLGIHGNGFYGADPFVFQSEGADYIVYEHYDYSQKKGKINLLKLDEQMNVIQVKTILESTSHLAYPFIFRYMEKIFMIPETAQENEVRLYEWNSLEESFVYVHTLISLPLVDVSILYHNGMWWLFGGNKTKYPNEMLFIYYSDELTGDYKPHLMNPVKVTPEGSRMGGQFSIENGNLFRYGQYSKRWYGEMLVKWNITKLSPDIFEEEKVKELMPEKHWNFHDGLHTFSFTDRLEVIDAKKRKSDLVSFKSQL